MKRMAAFPFPLPFLLNMSSALLVRDAGWGAVRAPLQRIVPTLSHERHKGQLGRVGVLGGSADYTGAPFYAAKAALLFGADLVFVFCDQQALIPIKSYSPEFMVTALYDSALEQRKDQDQDQKKEQKGESEKIMVEKMRASLWRLHVVVMGPGLGR